jgi:RHS repeat-associated protein
MTSICLRARGLSCALLAGTAAAALLPAAAAAQTNYDFRQVDANGVDLVRGDFVLSFTEGAIGSGKAAMSLIRTNAYSQSQWDHYTFRRTLSGSTATFAIGFPGGVQDRFTGAASLTSWAPAKANGATLTRSGWTYTYTAPDGTTITFIDPTWSGEAGFPTTSFCSDGAQTTCDLVPESIDFPDGRSIAFDFTLYDMPDGAGGTAYEYRLAKVTNGFGHAVGFAYQDDSYSYGSPPSTAWRARSRADFFNNAVSTTSAQASVSYAYPSGYGGGSVDVTDMAGNAWRVTATSIRRPAETSAGYAATVNSSTGIVSSVTRDGVTTSYSRPVSGSTGTMTVTDALSHATTIVSNLSIGRPTSVTDANSHTTGFSYDSSGRLTRTTAPEGNYVQLTLDSRGNATQTQAVAKDGTTTLTTSASYPSSCTNTATCNLPTSTTDALGNATSYTYDAYGNVTAVTLPLPTSTATVHPETRYTYGLAGVTGISSCQTGSAPSCVGTSDEVKATIGYDSQGNATSASSGNGAGTLTATSAMTYDAMGNVLTLDGPLSGSADTTRYRYDPARRLVGVTSPDPDGSGSMKPRATKTTYNSSGLPTKVEQGTVNSQSDSDWAAFSSLQEVDTGYDSNFRPVTQSLVSGGTTYALTQVSYDAVGGTQCSAQRMNPTYFGSLPSDACTLGTTSTTYGADRITKKTYDAAGQTTLVQSAYGVTGVQADEVATAYTNNGKVASVTDAEGNKTSYVYDGFDRLYQTLYPSTTKGAGTSNSSDYEQLGYDANGNVASFRNRANETIAFSYDALNRLTTKDLPGTEPDVTFAYDLLGRMTSAATSAQTLSFTYDALGRNLTQVGPQGTVTSAWDIAGRRTRITHPDSFYVDQDYLVTGELQKIRENGATSGVGVLATYAYDDLGRRNSLTLGDGTSTSYGYDAGSRLTSLGHDLSGTSYDQTLGFSYNPASEITQNTRSNDAYAWTGHYNVNRGYTANGLNQYTASGPVTPTYDGKGNLTSAGSTTYGYSSENLLTSASGGITLSYDPAMRLYQTAGGTPGTTRFAYDGTDLVGEYSGSNTLQRRFVHGPATDEPIVWYEGSGTTDRRFLHSDERGSIASITSSSGTSVNTYDEYGIPRSSNTGRFQYTGQTWLPELGMYYYKARLYSPTLGRFLQTDPIGSAGGMNLYAYVGGNPVTRTDPLGLQQCYTNHYVEYEYYDVNNNRRHDPGEGVVPGSVSVNDSNVCFDDAAEGSFAQLGLGGGVQRNSHPSLQEAACIQDYKAYHDAKVASAATAARAAGFRVVFNVSFRVLVAGPGGKATVGPRAVADFVATRNGGQKAGDLIIFELKTGNADYSVNQSMVYPLNGPTIVIPVGANAAAAGFAVGVPRVVIPKEFQVQRCPR